MQDPTDERPPSLLGFVGVMALIAALLVVDLTKDWSSGTSSGSHVALEAVAALAALGAAAWMLLSLRTRHAEVRRLSADLAATREEAERWRQEAGELVKGLSEAIDHQFDRWELSPAEREIALLLLKGLSTRQIAEFRSTREATVRQQAQGIYRKAGLEGRAELAAFFLEDLLAPHGA